MSNEISEYGSDNINFTIKFIFFNIIIYILKKVINNYLDSSFFVSSKVIFIEN